MVKREQDTKPKPATDTATGSAWIRDGVRLPDGTKLRINYPRFGIDTPGEVLHGRLAFDGASYLAPSPAVINAILKTTGRRQSANGWSYIEALLDGEWKPINSLRGS